MEDYMAGTMNDLFNNKLFLQYLSGMGQDISSGNAIGTNTNQITQQNIAAQNYAKLEQRYEEMFKKMLKGDYSDGGKWTEDANGVTLKMPVDNLLGGDSAYNTGGAAGVTSNLNKELSGTQQTPKNASQNQNAINPSTSPTISGADLAGLTPQMISQALSDAQGASSVGYMSPAEVQDMLYKNQLIEASKENVEVSKASRLAKDTPKEVEYFPIEVPGLGKVTVDQWKALPTDQQSYAAYVYQSKQLRPDESIMSLTEWKRGTDKNTQLEYLKGLQEDPTLFKTAKDLAQAGAMNLGERQSIKEMEDTVEDKNYFVKPKGGLIDDVDSYVNSKEVKKTLRQYEDDKTKGKETIRLKEKYITNKITSSGGIIQGARLEGRTFIWTVKWPDGTTSEVKYAN